MIDSTSELKLVLLTADFPYGYGEQFLETEILYLSKRFQRVIILPYSIKGQPRLLPPNVQVDSSLANFKPARLERLMNITSLRLLFGEIKRRPELLVQPSALAYTLGRLSGVIRTYWWLPKFISTANLDLKKTVFYTYWLLPTALGIGLARDQLSQIKLISRAHGHDLYEKHEPDMPYALPFKASILRTLDQLFTISRHGRDYLVEQYPWVSEICTIARLGVSDPRFTTPCSTDDVFRIISCSYLKPIKAIDRVITGLQLFSTTFPSLKLQWHHFGDGIMRNQLENMARQLLPESVAWCFHGQVSNPEVMEFYRTHPVDVFINTSVAEGIPVSIMEAQSCGIPVIAPAVGGIPEIVNNENGILLSKDLTPEMIADAFAQIVSDTELRHAKRIASKNTWREYFNAEVNFNAFADRIIELFGK